MFEHNALTTIKRLLRRLFCWAPQPCVFVGRRKLGRVCDHSVTITARAFVPESVAAAIDTLTYLPLQLVLRPSPPKPFNVAVASSTTDFSNASASEYSRVVASTLYLGAPIA